MNVIVTIDIMIHKTAAKYRVDAQPVHGSLHAVLQLLQQGRISMRLLPERTPKGFSTTQRQRAKPARGSLLLRWHKYVWQVSNLAHLASGMLGA